VPVSYDSVIWAYRMLLGREPESPHVIELHASRHENVDAMRANFLRIAETQESFRKLGGILMEKGKESEKNTAATPAADGSSAPTSLESLFPIIYKQNPDADEATQLKSIGVLAPGDTTRIMRRIIGATDRQRRPTPFIIRFGHDDLGYAQVDDFELAVDLADYAIGAHIMMNHKYEPHLGAFFRKNVKQGMHVVDIGANIGYYAVLASKLVGERGHVTAFEPNSENARLILLSVERNRIKNVKLLPVALSTQMGNAFFSAHVGSNGGLLPSNTDVLVSSQCDVVPTFRLDQLVSEHIDFLKIDVEGAEGLVFEGAWSLIERDRPIICSEFSPEMLLRVSGVHALAYIERFTSIGYRMQVLDRSKSAGEGVEIPDPTAFMANFGSATHIEDIVFMPPDSAARL
jgi:FkbM family methyltransferase